MLSRGACWEAGGEKLSESLTSGVLHYHRLREGDGNWTGKGFDRVVDPPDACSFGASMSWRTQCLRAVSENANQLRLTLFLPMAMRTKIVVCHAEMAQPKTRAKRPMSEMKASDVCQSNAHAAPGIIEPPSGIG